MKKVSPEIVEYVEKEILPRYGKVGGHTDLHIRQVIERSLRFFKQAPDLNIDMVYVIAAYHDLGRLVDNEMHNIESAKMLRKDEFLKVRFSVEEIEIMAEAVEDHRASLGREPRSIYGKLVSSADRNTDVDTMLRRVYEYNKYLHPEMSEEEVLNDACYHLRRKYAPGGYAVNTMYFDDPVFAETLVKIEEITRDMETFKREIKRVYKAK